MELEQHLKETREAAENIKAIFKPVVDNVDLWVNPDPEDSRVAVICRWKDAKTFGPKHFPNAAVVGPLRTVRGLDGLIRNLIANPQIRLVILAGVDLTPGEQTTEALMRLWDGLGWKDYVPAIEEKLVQLITDHVTLAMKDDIPGHVDSDRTGGSIVLPPPVPEATASAPHGDPGQRIAGDTFKELWPQVLHQALRFGRGCPTHYGETREIWNLVSVVRDPEAAVDLPPWAPAHDQVDEYARRLYGNDVPEGAPYSYGSRMHGSRSDYEQDQIRGLFGLLTDKPDTRAGYVTPWIPTLDAGKESGRPCLVAVQFRAVPSGELPADFSICSAHQERKEGCKLCYPVPPPTLHMNVMFRSHDLYGAYCINLAAACKWLTEWAGKLGMHVGTLTCLSASAHVYERDYNAAGDVIASHWPRGINLDQRSTWRVERGWAEVYGEVRNRYWIRATALTPDGSEIVEIFEGKTAEAVQRKIVKSGLVTSIGGAMWLGRELVRVEHQCP